MEIEPNTAEYQCPMTCLVWSGLWPVMDWVFVSSQNWYVETLSPNMMASGGGDFRS